jgi:diguanylate cyclase (GGDEF)-like protein
MHDDEIADMARLKKMSHDQLIEIAHGKVYYRDNSGSTITREDFIREARIELEKRRYGQPKPMREKEQKFGIVYSLKQAKSDFAEYSSGQDACVSVGVLFLDIDDFKPLNTRFTESTVDRDVLVPFQQLLYDASVHRGNAYRHGGEEFLMILPNHTREEVTQFAERLRQTIETKEFHVDGNPVTITVSIGIALWPGHGKTLDELTEKANKAEHEAKARGKNRIEVCSK